MTTTASFFMDTTQGKYGDFEKFLLTKLNSRLKIRHKIKPINMNTCHVIPSRINRLPSIIIKFVRSIRDLAYANKKWLKDENHQRKLLITESLACRRSQLVTDAKNTFGFKIAWNFNDYNVYIFHKNCRQLNDDFVDIDWILTLKHTCEVCLSSFN